jgi:hypothetical protein
MQAPGDDVTKPRKPSKRNPIARDLRSGGKYAPRVIASKKLYSRHREPKKEPTQ